MRLWKRASRLSIAHRNPVGALAGVGPLHDVWFVAGVEGGARFPTQLARAGLTHRIAVIQHTARLDDPDMSFNEALWGCLVDYAQGYVPDGALTVVSDVRKLGKAETGFTDFQNAWARTAADDRAPPAVLAIRVAGSLRLCLLREDWYAVGGPFPYADSYTYSVFSDRDLGVDLPAFLAARAAGRWNQATEVLAASA